MGWGGENRPSSNNRFRSPLQHVRVSFRRGFERARSWCAILSWPASRSGKVHGRCEEPWSCDFLIVGGDLLRKWALAGLSSSAQLWPACRPWRSTSCGGEPCPGLASANFTIGKGESADFRSDISTHRHLATSARGLGAAPLCRRSSCSSGLFKHCNRALERYFPWAQPLALICALSRLTFWLCAACAECAAVSLIQEVFSGQRRTAGSPS